MYRFIWLCVLFIVYVCSNFYSILSIFFFFFFSLFDIFLFESSFVKTTLYKVFNELNIWWLWFLTVTIAVRVRISFRNIFISFFNLTPISFEIINFFQSAGVIRRINFNVYFFEFIFLNASLNVAFSLKLLIIYYSKYVLRNAPWSLFVLIRLFDKNDENVVLKSDRLIVIRREESLIELNNWNNWN